MTKGSWWSNKHRKYKYQDKKAGLEYNLTLDQAKALMSIPCFYCCRPESKGLDRISNDFGHTTSNVVPCCGTCNLMLASTPWAAKIEMRESLRSIREKGLLGSWKPPYLTEPAKTVNVPLENEDVSESPKAPVNNKGGQHFSFVPFFEGSIFKTSGPFPHPPEVASMLKTLNEQELEKVVVPTKEKIQEALQRSAERYSRRVPPSPPPRYDEVYHEGTAFLDSGEDCPAQPPSSTVPLTAEKVRELLEEGRECRKELFKRIRVMERLTPEMMNDKAKSSVPVAPGYNELRKIEMEAYKEKMRRYILTELEKRGPMSPRDLELSFATHNQKDVRVAMQDLIDNGRIELKNLQLQLTSLSREDWNKLIESDKKRTRDTTIMGLDWPEDEEPIDPEGIQTC